ncbi:pentapeptide repeat-containing protein [Paracraurococcus lichenis]|uniref:Pentapeptide repeat-containing protein n=1 Tax=Paracraurococcus lichenis TaxID=3064888 RepID=A0ABT9EDD9_9PROT|nr:pentapeptide repeat-containing protein [Paracraurococcus sp. LOR1-02]MDO9714219.1 pentapeptide repeat-containing protein [Paracraurococcus sp. LOR1-02]
MANADHLERLRQGAEAWNVWREEQPYIRPDLSEANIGRAHLSDVNFREAFLRKVNLRNAFLFGADLSGADLSGADLSEADLISAKLGGANLREADLAGANLSGANLSEANLSGAKLREANLSGANLWEVKLSGADLSKANLSGASLFWADLREANLQGADLSGANLRKASLSEANLFLAYLREADLEGADLSGANLRKTDLSGANLFWAGLKRANLIDAHLDRANLTGAELWEAQRADWSIQAVICRRAYWDRKGEEPIEYAEGEFERIFAEKPRIVLRYPGGMSPIDLLALPLVVERLQAEHPDSLLRVRSMQDDAGGVAVTITVEDLKDRSAEAFGHELVRIQAKLECIVEERDHLRQRLGAMFSEGISKMAEFLSLPRQEVHVHSSSGLTAIEGPAMSRDTYNISGQAAVVGPGAHAQDNSFQQAQGGNGLPGSAEKPKHLRKPPSE